MAETQGDLVSNPTDDHPCQDRERAGDLQRQLNRARAERDNLQRVVDSNLISIQFGLEDILENHLSCPVCKEVVICANEVACGHLFCSDCVKVRMRQPDPSCPICGKPITDPTRVKTWDTFLHQIYKLLPEKTQQNREEIIKQRSEQLEVRSRPPAVSQQRRCCRDHRLSRRSEHQNDCRECRLDYLRRRGKANASTRR